VPKYSDFPHFTVWRSDGGFTQLNNIRAESLDDFPQSEPIAESAPMALSHFADFPTAIGKLGPVQTAGSPLMEYGCRGNSFFSLRQFAN
jgi:hypothetical protein